MKKFIVLLALLTLIIYIPIFNLFTISDGHTDKLIFIGDLKDFKEFDVTFTHSVNKTPVKEFYKINSNIFNLYKAEFTSYGAGMSDGTDLENAEIYHGENDEIFLSMDEDFETITYYVGTIADHRITYKDKTIHLNEILNPQTPAVLEVKRISVLDILKVKIEDWGLKNRIGQYLKEKKWVKKI